MARLRSVPQRPRSVRKTNLGKLQTAQLAVLALCRKLCNLPDAPAESAVGRAQRLFRDGHHFECIASLSDFLQANKLQAVRSWYALDPQRFAAARTLQNASMAQLARAIGCTPGHICHIERGRNGISLPLLLVTLAILDLSGDALGVVTTKDAPARKQTSTES